jgi:hypothetical protein
MTLFCLFFFSNSGLPSISALHDVWPLSSKVLMQSVIPTTSGLHSKPDPAALLAENHALRDAMEQQRFKLKVNLMEFAVFCSLLLFLSSKIFDC